MAAVHTESGTVERRLRRSSSFARHFIAPLQRASSKLGSGDLWQMHADADAALEAAALAEAAAAPPSPRRAWKLRDVMGRMEKSLSRFSKGKPPRAATRASTAPASIPRVSTASEAPLKSPRTTSATPDASTPSPKSSNPASRRFKQRGTAEAQIRFRVSPSSFRSDASASADPVFPVISSNATPTNRRVVSRTSEEPIGRVGPPSAPRHRGSASMGEVQLHAWMDDRDGGERSIAASTAGDVAASLDDSRRGEHDAAASPEWDNAEWVAACAPPLARRGRGSPCSDGSSSVRNGSRNGCSRGGSSSRAVVVGVTRSVTAPTSPSVRHFSFHSYRHQMTAQ